MTKTNQNHDSAKAAEAELEEPSILDVDPKSNARWIKKQIKEDPEIINKLIPFCSYQEYIDDLIFIGILIWQIKADCTINKKDHTVYEDILPHIIEQDFFTKDYAWQIDFALREILAGTVGKLHDEMTAYVSKLHEKFKQWSF